MNRNLVLELVRVTEAAALACGRWVGKGNKMAADEAATDAMRKMLDSLGISGTVVIGEGEMDEAPMLYIGEKVGQGGHDADIAVDPLEGTTICAKGKWFLQRPESPTATCSRACVISPAAQPRILSSCAQPAERYGLSRHVIISTISRAWTDQQACRNLKLAI